MPNIAQMNRLGVSTSTLAQTIRVAFEGVEIGTLTLDGEEVPFHLSLDKSNINGDEIISRLQVPNNLGQLIDVSRMVSIQEVSTLESISRYNGRRTTGVLADINEKVTTSAIVNKMVQEKFAKKFASDPRVTLVVGGEEKSTQESFESLARAFVIAIVGIYITLSILFNSISRPLLILSTVPFGICGVIISFYFHGMPISFFAMIGSMGLMGILVNDGLIMVSHLDAVTKSEGLNLGSLIKASKDRFRAVMLTTVSTSAGMIPTIYGLGGHQPFLVPLVLAVAGGLIFGTLITLVLIPLVYSLKLKEAV